MKILCLRILTIFSIAVFLLSCGQSTREKTPTSKADSSSEIAEESDKIIVYYFHSKQRCKTCLTIQEIVENTIKQYFSDHPDVVFKEVDYSNPDNSNLADKYQVAMSSLIIVKGTKLENLTDIAFANALRNPDTLKTILIEKINKLLNEKQQ